MSGENPWVTLDEYDDDFIVGNQAGLKHLKASIDVALKNGNALVMEDANEFVIRRVLLREKDEYLNSIKVEAYKDNIWQKIIASFLVFWFIALPFVAVGLGAYIFLSE